MKKPFNELKQDVLLMIDECSNNEAKSSVMNTKNILELGQWLVENEFWDEEDFQKWFKIVEFN